jgi:hypothetical protein
VTCSGTWRPWVPSLVRSLMAVLPVPVVAGSDHRHVGGRSGTAGAEGTAPIPVRSPRDRVDAQ